jgi:hypothetical protein
LCAPQDELYLAQRVKPFVFNAGLDPSVAAVALGLVARGAAGWRAPPPSPPRAVLVNACCGSGTVLLELCARAAAARREGGAATEWAAAAGLDLSPANVAGTLRCAPPSPAHKMAQTVGASRRAAPYLPACARARSRELTGRDGARSNLAHFGFAVPGAALPTGPTGAATAAEGEGEGEGEGAGGLAVAVAEADVRGAWGLGRLWGDTAPLAQGGVAEAVTVTAVVADLPPPLPSPSY